MIRGLEPAEKSMTPRYHGLSFHLQALARDIPNKRSAEHSRLTILAAAARMAGTQDFPEMTVPDICQACGISRATFYLHFDGRDSLFAELMRQLTALESSLTPSLAACPDVAAGIRAIVDWYIDVHLANASLFHNLTFLRRTNLEINESWLERARILHRAVADELKRFPECRALPHEHADFVLEFFGGGMNSVVSRVNTKLPRNPYVPTDLAKVKASVARLLYRSLFGADAAVPVPAPRRRVRAR